jgi:hypothetical protein
MPPVRDFCFGGQDERTDIQSESVVSEVSTLHCMVSGYP